MPVKGQDLYIDPYIIAQETDVIDAAKMAATKAFRTFLTMMMGEPDATYGYGVKRAGFRRADLMALATAGAATMQVELAAGTAVMNGGSVDSGILYLVYAASRAKSVTHAAAHATLDRYDIIYATPTQIESSPVSREAIDDDGNVSAANYNRLRIDDFDLAIEPGTAGAGYPTTGGDALDNTNAWEYLDEGKIPIAVVKVAAAATTIPQANITDIREIFQYRAYPVNETDGGIDDLIPIQPPNHIGQLYRLNDITAKSAVPQTTIYLDCTGANPILKYCDHNSAHHTIDLTAE
jgi:hypothetical protein